MNTHKIQLNKYLAKNTGDPLRLGTAGSHGNEYLQVTPGEGWKGLKIQVIFHPCQVACMLPSDGLLEVPWEATAEALTVPQGRIVFQGFDADRLVNSTDLIYTVSEHSSTTGRDEEPYTPGIVEGVLNQMEADKADILDAAQKAVLAQEAAERSETAAQSCQQEAAKSADRAETAAELSKISTEAAQSSVQSAAASASAADISAAEAANSAANASETLAQVQAAGQEANQNVKDAERAALDKIAAVLPAVSIDTARQSLTVAPDGTSYTLTAMAPLASAICPTVSGNPAACSDSIAWSFQGLKIYGKSTQDGTPSLENPVPIVSTGESGSIICHASNNNLSTNVECKTNSNDYGSLVISRLICEIPKNTKITFSVDLECSAKTKAYWNINFCSDLGSVDFDVAPGLHRYSRTVITQKLLPTIGQKLNMPISKSGTGDGIPIRASNFCISLGGNSDFMEATAQPLTLFTPSGLSGIPVDNGGNYTDASGQQWICDMVDYGAKLKIQNYIQIVLTGNESWSKREITDADCYQAHFDDLDFGSTGYYPPSICNYFKNGTHNEYPTFYITGDGCISFSFASYGTTAVEDFKAFLRQKYQEGNPVIVISQRSTSITTPLSAEEFAAYRALQTYHGTTIVSTAEPVAGIEAKYIMDGTTAWNKVTDALSQLRATNIYTS